jgi:hypothetical protein
MKINIYVSEGSSPVPRYGFLPPDNPLTLLPRGEKWTYVWSADTRDFNLPEAVEEEIERHGFWAHGSRSGSR